MNAKIMEAIIQDTSFNEVLKHIFTNYVNP